jgi:hypothetical protein
MMSNTIEAEATLENCRALINQINAGLSAEEPFANVSSATELLLHLECADSALKRSVHARESVGRRRSSPSIIGGAANRHEREPW